jgi:acetyl-CoA carboxylase alpha subunit
MELCEPILLHALENISTLDQDGCVRLGVGFARLSDQNVTSIGIQEKMEDLGEKLKTNVSKISPGSRAKN